MLHVSRSQNWRVVLVAMALFGALAVQPATAPADDNAGVIIDLNAPKRSLYPLALPVAVSSDGAAAKQINEILSFNMGIAGWFKVLDPKGFLANLEGEGLGIEPDAWKNVGAYGVVKYRVTTQGDRIDVEFRLYEVEKGKNAVLTRSYKGVKDELRSITHKFSNDLVEYYTSEKGFFGSRIAFVTKSKGGGKTIMAMDFDGSNPFTLTRNTSLNILPAWSPRGGQVAFTSYMRNNPDLYIVSAGGGRPKRVSKQYGMNTGASWSPDGSKLAITLSKDGNPEIYIIKASDGSVISRLTDNRAIDTSPAWSPDGSEIAFVSDREGGPQIYVMSASGGAARRVSLNGDYNTTPTWNPVKGSRQLAYTIRDGGKFDIVTLDLNTKKMVRITQGQGNNEEPSFSPNGRAIAFASVRKEGTGVYVANADGSGKQLKVWSGYATSVDWGPMP